VFELLLRNDPSETEVCIRLRNFTDDVALSEALPANNHVNTIVLYLNDLLRSNHTSNWDSLLRILTTRENLKEVSLRDDAVIRNPRARVVPFLLALQQNRRIQTVNFHYLQLSGDSMVAFLDAATSITALKLWRCDMEAPGGALAVAAALQRNTNIQRLELCHLDLDEVDLYLIPILTSLASNTSLQELNFQDPVCSIDVSLALKNLLESTETIQKFECNGSMVDMNMAQGLIRSRSVTDVKLESCWFDSQERWVILKSILGSKSNLQSLTLGSCTVHEDAMEEFRSAIVSLLQPRSSLRSLEFSRREHLSRLGYGFDTFQSFNRLLTAVESSPLESLSIKGTVSGESWLALIGSIPRMQVLNLEFKLQQDLQDLKVDLLQAVKRNASLRSVLASLTFGDLFNDEDRMELTSYYARNEFLAQWMTSPDAVPVTTWPEYLAVAKIAGPDPVFRILQGLAPSLWAAAGD
jgi:hypothetical protein